MALQDALFFTRYIPNWSSLGALKRLSRLHDSRMVDASSKMAILSTKILTSARNNDKDYKDYDKHDKCHNLLVKLTNIPTPQISEFLSTMQLSAAITRFL